MTLVLILILVVLWLVVLTPAFVKKRLEHRSTGSIDSFHRRLHLLERTGPKLVAPAYRLETARSSTGMAPGQSGLPSVSSMPGRPNLVLLQPVGDGAGEGIEIVDEVSGEHYLRVSPQPTPVWQEPGSSQSLASRADAYRQEQARRRRRDVLLGLGATVTLTAPLGVVHELHPLWIVTVMAVMALAGYVGLAAYAQIIETDRREGTSSTRGSGRRRASALSVQGYPGAWDEEPAERSWAAAAGYPGAWDEEYYAEPRQAAAGG